MIEKSFEKSYGVGVKNGVLTRAANRLIKEYTEAIGRDYGIPDEVKAAAEKIKNMQEVENYEDEYKNTMSCTWQDFRPYDSITHTFEAQIYACWSEDEYGDPVYFVRWYFYSTEYYEKRIGDKKITARSWQEIEKKTFEARGKYRYFCTHRPPAPGCIPAGFVHYETYLPKSNHIGEVTYNEQPAAEELSNWGLVFDPDYERLRSIYLGGVNQ